MFGNCNNEKVTSVRNRKPPKTDLGRRLTAAMDARGLSQQELSANSGVSQSFISQLRTGARQDLSSVRREKLEKALGVSLRTDEPDEHQPAGVKEFLDSDLARGISTDERRIIEQAAWAVPPGKTTNMGDWYAFLRWLQGLPKQKGDK